MKELLYDFRKSPRHIKFKYTTMACYDMLYVLVLVQWISMYT